MNTINSEGKWNDIASDINANFSSLLTQFMSIKRFVGFFQNEDMLLNAYPTALEGTIAFVFNQEQVDCLLYVYENQKWNAKNTMDIYVDSYVPNASTTQDGLLTAKLYGEISQTFIDFDE